MAWHPLKRRTRQQIQLQVEELSRTAEKGIDRNLFRRFDRLLMVKRFVGGWVLLMLLFVVTLGLQFAHLSSYYQRLEPVPGGIYTEGEVGQISNINPLFAASDVDRSLSRLVFSGLLTHDANGNLVPDLAQNYQVTNSGRLYTVTLKRGLSWQDGKPLTSADVLFTFNTIKNPDAVSPLLSAWRNISVAAPDPYTVTFNLSTPLASFPYSLTTGIVPQHVLGSIKPSDLRSADFNSLHPVGSGPFSWHGLQVTGNDPQTMQEQVALIPFDGYALGTPKLGEFIVRSYANRDALGRALKAGRVSAAVGLQQAPAGSPKDLQQHSLLMAAGTYVFFKTSGGILADKAVRQALVAASDPSSIIKRLGFLTMPVTEPLLSGQLGFDKRYAQGTNNVDSAKNILAQDGWAANTSSVLHKNGQPLEFTLTVNDTPENRLVAETLKQQWRAVGIGMGVDYLSDADYATALAAHQYDATLRGISIGTDPDVYAYWDGTQADVRSGSRLNLSEWNNTSANMALEAGRTRLDPALRVIKYAPFLQAWQQDAPALGLYQPRFLYLSNEPVYGLTQHVISDTTDRFNGVQDWQVRTALVTPR